MPASEAIWNFDTNTKDALDAVVPSGRVFRGPMDPSLVLPNKGFAEAYLYEENDDAIAVIEPNAPGGEQDVTVGELPDPYEGQVIYVDQWFNFEEEDPTDDTRHDPHTDVQDGTLTPEPALVVITNVVDLDDSSRPGQSAAVTGNDWEVFRVQNSAAQHKASQTTSESGVVPITNTDGELDQSMLPALPTGTTWIVEASGVSTLSDWMALADITTAVDGASSLSDFTEGDYAIIKPANGDPNVQYMYSGGGADAAANWVEVEGSGGGGGGAAVDSSTTSTEGTVELATNDEVQTNDDANSVLQGEEGPIVVQPKNLRPWLKHKLKNLTKVATADPQPGTDEVDKLHDSKVLAHDAQNDVVGTLPLSELSPRLSSSLQVNGVSVGNLNNGSILQKGQSIQKVLRDMLQQVYHPNYSSANAGISDVSNPPYSQQDGKDVYVESGVPFTIEVSPSTSENQNGALTSYEFIEDGSTAESGVSNPGNFTVSSVTLGSGTDKTIRFNATFNETPDSKLVPNNLQDPDDDGTGEVELGESYEKQVSGSWVDATNALGERTRGESIKYHAADLAFWRFGSVVDDLYKGTRDPGFTDVDYAELKGSGWARTGDYTLADTLMWSGGEQLLFDATGYGQFIFAIPQTIGSVSNLEYRSKPGDPWDDAGSIVSKGTYTINAVNYNFQFLIKDSDISDPEGQLRVTL